MPRKKGPGEEKKIPKPICIEDSKWKKFDTACKELFHKNKSAVLQDYIYKVLEDYEKHIQSGKTKGASKNA